MQENFKKIEIIPLKRLKLASTLSYYSVLGVTPGDVVEVDYRSKKVNAVVISVSDVTENKTQLKAQPYKLKSISKVVAKSVLSKNALSSLVHVSDHFALSVAEVFSHTVSLKLVQSLTELGNVSKSAGVHSSTRIAVTGGMLSNRIDSYLSVLSISAIGSSFVIVVDNRLQLNLIKDELTNHAVESIELFSFHSEMTAGQLQKELVRLKSSSVSNVVIITKKYLSLPLQQISAIAYEGSDGTTSRSESDRVGLFFLQQLSSKISPTLFVRQFSSFDFLKFADDHNVDTPPSSTKTESFAEVIELDKNNFAESLRSSFSFNDSERILVLSTRTGYATTTVCSDCKKTLSCKNCSTPLVLYKRAVDGNEFRCNKCLEVFPSLQQCPNCESWQLKPLGYPLEKIVELVREIHGESREVFYTDATSDNTAAKIAAKLDEFYSSENSILIATPRIVPFLGESIDKIYLCSVESLLALPVFDINLRIARLLANLGVLTDNKISILSTKPDHPLLESLHNNSLEKYLKDQREMATKLRYPPHFLIIKINIAASDEESLGRKRDIVLNLLKKYQPERAMPFVKVVKGMRRELIIVRIERDTWPIPDLVDKLRVLRREFDIEVDTMDLM